MNLAAAGGEAKILLCGAEFLKIRNQGGVSPDFTVNFRNQGGAPTDPISIAPSLTVVQRRMCDSAKYT